jgi:protein SCO1/2
LAVLKRSAGADCQDRREYRVYYKKIPTSDGSYVMDHSSMIYLMDASENFDAIISYQENDASAVAKLKSLALQAPTS